MNPSETEICGLLQSEGVKAEDFTRVSSSVYRVRATHDSLSKWYLKVFPVEKSKHFLTLAELGNYVGLPSGQVLTTSDFGIYMMEPAEGTMLSSLLPKALVPGIWYRRKNQLQNKMITLGVYIRRLHEATRRDTSTIPVDALYLDKFDAVVDGQLDSRIRNALDSDVVDIVEDVLNRHRELTLDTSLVHGDLILRHVFLGEEDVTIIDIDRVGVAGSLEDCISFDCTLELMVRRLPYARVNQYEHLIDSFYSGYGEKPRSAAKTILTLVKYCSLLLYYISKTDSIHNIKRLDSPELVRYFDLPILKRRIRHLVTTHSFR